MRLLVLAAVLVLVLLPVAAITLVVVGLAAPVIAAAFATKRRELIPSPAVVAGRPGLRAPPA